MPVTLTGKAHKSWRHFMYYETVNHFLHSWRLVPVLRVLPFPPIVSCATLFTTLSHWTSGMLKLSSVPLRPGHFLLPGLCKYFSLAWKVFSYDFCVLSALHRYILITWCDCLSFSWATSPVMWPVSGRVKMEPLVCQTSLEVAGCTCCEGETDYYHRRKE